MHRFPGIVQSQLTLKNLETIIRSEHAEMQDMMLVLKGLAGWVGNAPLKKLNSDLCNLYVKLEGHNSSGSVKVWAASYMIEQAVRCGQIRPGTLVVESSSGNFAIALAFICRRLKVDFIPVIDPNINQDYEKLLRTLCKKVVKVETRDKTGGYLLTRIETVKHICDTHPNSFWPNQYENENNFKAYYHGLAPEIASQFDRLDYLFTAVSSCGTVTGLSIRLKEVFPNIRVVAVDLEGSVIFGAKPALRFVSGLGASKVPSILNNARIDEVIHISHEELFDGCQQLLDEQHLLSGASTGCVYAAIKKYFHKHGPHPDANAVFISPDQGHAYLDTIFNPQWRASVLESINKPSL